MQKRIILVDDESSLRRSLSMGLTQEGYDVEPCENGINALKKLYLYKKNDIEVETVVLDIKLPDIDGIKLGKIIKSKYPDTNILFISGYSDRFNLQEVQNLSTTGLLEKPFTSQDITYKLKELAKHKTISTPVYTQIPKKEIKTFSAYVLLKINEKADFFSIYRQLYYDTHILYCDATKGNFGIFLLIQAQNIDDCKKYCNEQIKTIKGIDEAEFLPVSNPILDESLSNIIKTKDKIFDDEFLDNQKRDLSKRVCSYLLLQVEREKIDHIYPTLCLDDNVVYCDFTNGNYNMVLMVHGTYFNDIDTFIENKLSNLDGILRVKEYPIINLYEM